MSAQNMWLPPSSCSFKTKEQKEKKKENPTSLQAICWNRSLRWRHAVNAPRPQINTWKAIFSKKVARRSYQGCTRNEWHQRISSVLDLSLLILDAHGSKMSSLVRVTLRGDDSEISLARGWKCHIRLSVNVTAVSFKVPRIETLWSHFCIMWWIITR